MKTKITIFSVLLAFFMFAGVGAMQAQNASKDTVTVQIELPNGQITKQDTVAEGDSLTLGGLPFPLHIMNGGQITFNDSSLTHDITLTISLPPFANVDNQNRDVSFGDSLANGVRFTVTAGDTVIDPFEFETPIDLTLPIPEDMPNDIGEQVSNFVLAYRDSTGQIDTTGIETTVSDTVEGIVSAEVSHFSDVVMTTGDETATSIEQPGETKPEAYKLYSNYPNPFNPTTTIGYDLKNAGQVKLTVYNTLGKKVATLVNERQQSGHHTVRFDASDLSSGIYLYRLQTENYSSTNKMTLIK